MIQIALKGNAFTVKFDLFYADQFYYPVFTQLAHIHYFAITGTNVRSI
jgi:hypothetical protein